MNSEQEPTMPVTSNEATYDPEDINRRIFFETLNTVNTVTNLEGVLNQYVGSGEAEKQTVKGIDFVSELSVSNLRHVVDALKEQTWDEETESIVSTFDSLLPQFAAAARSIHKKQQA